MRYLLVFNPIAGRGRARDVAQEVQGRLERDGHSVELAASERAGHIREIARERGADVDRLLVLGGDGSLREAAAGLIERERATRPDLGVLPFGTGNVVVRELGLPLDPVAAAGVLSNGESGPWDVGELTAGEGAPPEVFLAMLGIGYDARVAERMGWARRGRWTGAWYRRHADSLYAALGVREALPGGATRFRVQLDGEWLEGTYIAAILSNAETYAKGMTMTPGADPRDGVFDLHLRSDGGLWTTARALLAAQRRRVPAPGVATLLLGTGFRFEAVGEEPLTWQLDGDPMPQAGELEVRVRQAELSLVGPSQRPPVAP